MVLLTSMVSNHLPQTGLGIVWGCLISIFLQALPILIRQGGKDIHVSVAEMRTVREPLVIWLWLARFTQKLEGSGRD